MNIRNAFVLISAANAEAINPDVNTWRHLDLAMDLRKHALLHIECEGRYEGKDEQSFAVFVRDPIRDRMTLLLLATKYGQESVLEVDSNGLARLTFLDGRPGVELGYFREAPRDTAEAQDAYTFVPMTGQYFVTEAA